MGAQLRHQPPENPHVYIVRTALSGISLIHHLHFSRPQCLGDNRTATTGHRLRLHAKILPFLESPLHHKNPVTDGDAEDDESAPGKEKLPPVTAVWKRKPLPSLATCIVAMTTRQVLLENVYKAHSRSGTHYQYSRFHLRPHDNLAEEYLTGPLFIRRVWSVHSGTPRPRWIDHENYKAFSIHTFSVHALESEVRLCQEYYATMPENQAVQKKLIAWATAVVPKSTCNDESGSLWPAQTPPRKGVEMSINGRIQAQRIRY
ncbi:hypothetical protein B0H14DRAFT_3131690 [Mycena olivaceomarginata]|nr:hypothetical protein B0H14DRAFT_3131690 [Mycena olivaceomarginata]